MVIRSLTAILLIIFSMSACVCHKQEAKTHEETPEQIVQRFAKERYIEGFKINHNNTEEYALVFKRFKKFSEIVPNLSYFVVSIRENHIVIEDTLTAGNVYWLNDYSIRAIIREQKAESRQRMYTYDVKMREYILD